MSTRWPGMLLLAACSGGSGPGGSGSDTGATTTGSTSTASTPTAAGWDPVAQTQADAMQAKLDQAVDDLGLTGAAMGLADAPQRQLWAGASGWSDTATAQEWTPERPFHIGSVTKTFTAAIVFQLDSEGLLSLDDPLDDWVPGYYDGLGITLRHLLSNTSGIVSYNWVGNFDSGSAWEPTELVAWAVSQEPDLHFTPGTQWEYSNTNFVLLGLVIEAATGSSYESEVEDRLTAPLGLADTYVAASGNDDPMIVSSYDVDGTDLTDSMDPSMGWAAGAMVSTPADLARWAALLYGGDVLADDALTAMTTQLVLPDGTTVDYGLGAFIEVEGANAIYGHTGGFAGYLTYMYYWKADGLALVAMSNQLETDLRDLAGYGWSVPLDFEYP